ncbi:hypothetical protein BCR43DRAFT_493158, partial [Syncephalastrum racemosum]
MAALFPTTTSRRSRLFTLCSVSVVVSSSPRLSSSLPSTTARRTSAASATLVCPRVPPTAVSESAATPTSFAPRRSSSKSLASLLVMAAIVGLTIKVWLLCSHTKISQLAVCFFFL